MHRVLGSLILLAAVLPLAACRLNYAKEEFRVTVAADGSASLAVRYQDFGSDEYESYLRNRDLEILKELGREGAPVERAVENGVAVTTRRLEYINYTVNATVEAEARTLEGLFNMLEIYEFRHDPKEGRYYLFPKNRVLVQGNAEKPGEIRKVGDRVAFVWPDTATTMAFVATYRVKGSSFRFEIARQVK